MCPKQRTQKPGKLVGPMVWLVPRYPEKPSSSPTTEIGTTTTTRIDGTIATSTDGRTARVSPTCSPDTGNKGSGNGGIIRLGSILTDPHDLESSFNLDSIPPIPSESIRDVSLAVSRAIVARSGKKDGFFAEVAPELGAILGGIPLPISAGPSVGWGREEERTTKVEAGLVKALVFLPSLSTPSGGVAPGKADDTPESYMDVALKNARVREYVRSGYRSKPLYMVVGVATAYGGVSLSETTNLTNSWPEMGISIGIPGLGEAELGVERERTRAVGGQAGIQEGCDFAYRVREFCYSRFKRKITKDKNFVEGALFGRDSHLDSQGMAGTGEGGEAEEEEILKFDLFEEEAEVVWDDKVLGRIEVGEDEDEDEDVDVED